MFPLTHRATLKGGLASQSGHGCSAPAPMGRQSMQVTDDSQAGPENQAGPEIKWGDDRFFSHLGVTGSSRGAARGGAGGLPVGGGFSGSSNNLDRGQEASAEAGLRLPDLPGMHRAGKVNRG